MGGRLSLTTNLISGSVCMNPPQTPLSVNTGKNAILVFRCKECNSSIIFDDSNDIVYLYRLAEESPLLYAKLALKGNGLQDYVDAMSEFN